jgi:arylsulfatase
VDDKDYQVPFQFTGKIDQLTVKLGPEELLTVGKGKIAKTFRDRQ